MTRVRVQVRPERAAEHAVIRVDYQKIEGTMFEVPETRRRVLVSVSAKGFLNQTKVVDVRGDEALVIVNLLANTKGRTRKVALLAALVLAVYAFARDRCGATVEACPRLSSTR